jgi:hypothetical protein
MYIVDVLHVSNLILKLYVCSMSYVISLAYMQNGTRSSKSNMGRSTNLSTNPSDVTFQGNVEIGSHKTGGNLIQD